MAQTYIQVTPTGEEYDPETVPDILRGLQQVTLPTDRGFIRRLLGSEEKPTFEFLVLTSGADDPVEFYYGVDPEEKIDILENRLRDIYPPTFDLERTEIDPAQRLVPHTQYEMDEFVERAQDGQLLSDFDLSEDQATNILRLTPSSDKRHEYAEGFDTDAETEVASDGGPQVYDVEAQSLLDECPEGVITRDQIPEGRSMNSVDKPVVEPDGTVHAHPPADDLVPIGVRWEGKGKRKRDWMCPLLPYDSIESLYEDRGRAPLASLIDHIGRTDDPLAFQVVFKSHRDWSGARTTREGDIRRGRDTFLQRWVKDLLEASYEKKDVEDLSTSAQRRLEAMESVDPDSTFKATVRALTVRHESEVDLSDGGPDRPESVTNLQGQLQDLKGEFYSLEPVRFRDEGRFVRLLQRYREKNAQKAFERFREGSIYKDDKGRQRSMCILTPRGLASLITAPTRDDLSVEASRGVRAKERSRNPLPRPDPDELSDFRSGMAIGYALDEYGRPEDDPVRVPPSLLTEHCVRFAGTGSGKSKGVINDMLSLHEADDGPTVLIDRKGDGMVENYLQAHYERFGDLDDVIYFDVPETLPRVPFLDVRPGEAQNRLRENIVQDKVDHFRQLLIQLMGYQRFAQAFVANEILAFLIKVLFDQKKQHDAFGLEELEDAVQAMHDSKSLPDVGDKNMDTLESLSRHFKKDEQQFDTSMDAAGNRIDILKENTFLWRMLKDAPEWDEENDCYADEVFDFREILDDDKVVLFDIGDLRSESSRAFTLVLLSNLWDALQGRKRDAREGGSYDDVINLIIEEAAPIAASSLVHEDLLPQGRSFGLGIELVMQFPEQVKEVTGGSSGQRAYEEILTNVHTRILGSMALTDEFANTLVTDDLDVDDLRKRFNRMPRGEWIVDLPDAEFMKASPPPFTCTSLEIPAGHPESATPLSGGKLEDFNEELAQLTDRTKDQYGLRSEDDGAYETGARGDVPAYETETDSVGLSRSPSSNSAADADDAPTEASSEGFRAFVDESALDEAQTTSDDEPEDSKADATDRGQTSSQTEPDGADASDDGDWGMDPDEFQQKHLLDDSPDDSVAGLSADSEPDQASGFTETPGGRSDSSPTDEQVSESQPAEEDDSAGPQQPTGYAGQTGRARAPTPSADGDPGGGSRDAHDTGGSDPRSGPRPTIDGPLDSQESDAESPTVAALEESDSGEVYEHHRVMAQILDAMNGDLPGYTLLDSMSEAITVDDGSLDDHVDGTFIEKHNVDRRRYYTLTEDGRDHLRTVLDDPADASVRQDEGQGDLGEKTPHKVGVALAEAWLQQQDEVDRVETYTEYGPSDTKYDVIAFSDGTPVYVCEVETSTNDYESIADDYEKLSKLDAQALWVVRDKSFATSTLSEALRSRQLLSGELSWSDQRSMDTVRSFYKQHSGDGVNAVWAFAELFEEVEQ